LNRVEDGFAFFDDMATGLEALFFCIDAIYTTHEIRTAKRFIARYAVMENVDLLRWENEMAVQLRCTVKQLETLDVRASRATAAIDLARALIACACGRPPTQWRSSPEWCAISDLALAQLRTGRWIDA
jgi:hypothetical protein